MIYRKISPSRSRRSERSEGNHAREDSRLFMNAEFASGFSVGRYPFG
jgi:hypothetical protein